MSELGRTYSIMLYSVLILLAVITMYSTNLVSAKSSELFINYLTSLIYQDCQGQDIHIKNGLVMHVSTNKSFTLLSWPYGKDDVRNLTEVLSENEPYDFYSTGCGEAGVVMPTGHNGCGALFCGSHKLDINQVTYFLDGVRVDVPKEEFQTTYGNNSPIIGSINNSQITTGNKSPINQTEQNFIIQEKDEQIANLTSTVTNLTNRISDFEKKQELNDMWKNAGIGIGIIHLFWPL